jgi:hypothetical protein
MHLVVFSRIIHLVAMSHDRAPTHGFISNLGPKEDKVKIKTEVSMNATKAYDSVRPYFLVSSSSRYECER